MSFWKKVCFELDYHGITRKELAYKIDVPVATINRAIERDSNPYALDAFRISKVLNVSLEYLLELPNTQVHKDQNDISDLQQIEMYKKYHALIDSIEQLPLEKQKKVIELVKTIIAFGK